MLLEARAGSKFVCKDVSALTKNGTVWFSATSPHSFSLTYSGEWWGMTTNGWIDQIGATFTVYVGGFRISGSTGVNILSFNNGFATVNTTSNTFSIQTDV